MNDNKMCGAVNTAAVQTFLCSVVSRQAPSLIAILSQPVPLCRTDDEVSDSSCMWDEISCQLATGEDKSDVVTLWVDCTNCDCDVEHPFCESGHHDKTYCGNSSGIKQVKVVIYVDKTQTGRNSHYYPKKWESSEQPYRKQGYQEEAWACCNKIRWDKVINKAYTGDAMTETGATSQYCSVEFESHDKLLYCKSVCHETSTRCQQKRCDMVNTNTCYPVIQTCANTHHCSKKCENREEGTYPVSVCHKEAWKCCKQETVDNIRRKADKCYIKRLTCANIRHCSKKWDCRREHVDCNNHQCGYRACNTDMRLIGMVKGKYVNIVLCVMFFLFFISSEMLSILVWYCVKLLYYTGYTIYCNPCGQYDLIFKKTFIEKWNRENVSKHIDRFPCTLTMSECFCLESHSKTFCESFRLSEISKYLYNIESHINMVRNDIMSVLCELHADFISVPQMTAYPLLSTLNHYLSRVQNEGHMPQDEEMYYEVRRFQSYNSVPIRASPMRLALSGFYATGSGDETRCYSCRMTYSDWRMMDQPDQIHRSISPDCPHLNNGDQRNVPMLSSTRDDNVTNVCGVIGEYSTMIGSSETMTSQPVATTATSTASEAAAAASAPSGVSSPDLPGLDISKAVYPQYRDLSSRLDSYQGWGWSHVQDPQVLARAGFYYAGYRDCVRCFHCGVGLRTWEREDDPWVEHVRWRSSCDYVRLMRGEQFAIQALTGNPSVLMSSPISPAETQTQNIHTAGMDAVAKAEEMGFRREQIERAVTELTGSQNASERRDIQLEILLERLMSEDLRTTGSTTHSSPLSIHTSTTVSVPSVSETVQTSPNMESHAISFGTMTSLVGPTPSGSIETSVSSQKTVEHGLSEEDNKHSRNAVGIEKTKEKRKHDIAEGTDISSANQERQLEEENQSLRDESTCKICMDNPSCIVFLPCGHLVTCAECAPALRKCPICRALIRGTVRAHTVSRENVNM